MNNAYEDLKISYYESILATLIEELDLLKNMLKDKKEIAELNSKIELLSNSEDDNNDMLLFEEIKKIIKEINEPKFKNILERNEFTSLKFRLDKYFYLLEEGIDEIIVRNEINFDDESSDDILITKKYENIIKILRMNYELVNSIIEKAEKKEFDEITQILKILINEENSFPDFSEANNILMALVLPLNFEKFNLKILEFLSFNEAIIETVSFWLEFINEDIEENK